MLALIQSRLNSKRLPKKALIKIFNYSLIEHVFLRLKKSKLISQIVICISNKKIDDRLAEILKSKKIPFMRGDLKNVANRLLMVAKRKKVESFVRISGDSPLIDYEVVDNLIKIYNKNKREADIFTNIFPRTFPSGQSVEIIKVKVLKDNIKYFKHSEKEHVTEFFYKNSTKFKIKNMINKNKIYKLNNKLSIDTLDDLKFLKKKYKKKLLNI